LINSDEVFSTKEYRKKQFICLLINTAHAAIEKNHLIEARDFLNVVETLFPPQGGWASWNLLCEQCAFKFAEGELKFVCGDEAGKAQIMELIKHLSLFGQEKASMRYQKYLNNLISCK
jgi:Rgg/GadR/MutR family transcriptional activator